ncbi:MAG: histidine kinase dimerization/phospho-acceptor domain-containing protein, partial [Oscillochloridaceae bacterium umkhey_bin13]
MRAPRSHKRANPRHSDQQTRRLLRGLLVLYQHLHTPQPIEVLLQAILDTAITYVPGGQRGSLLVLQGDQGRFAAAYGYDLAQLQQVQLPRHLIEAQFTDGPSSQLSSFVALDEAHLDPAILQVMYEHGKIAQIRRTLLTKITVGGELYGTLALDNLRSHAPFPAPSITLAQIFAEQAGTLIEQALLVEDLRSTNARLIATEQLATLGRLIASVAHQLNNPLTAVFGYSELLATEPLDPELLEMVEQLVAAAEQMRIHVRALQIFARQQQHGPSHLNLNLLIEQLATL